MERTALISQIQRFAVNDGPGFRTIVFFKGCPLRCKWCHNPEMQSFTNDIFWKKWLCVQCGACFDACPQHAILPPVPVEVARREGSSYHKIDRSKCNNCLECISACSYGALESPGKAMTVEEVVKEVESDRLFYENSGGGVTISGGEPTVHGEFIRELIDALKVKAIHICLDTSGYVSWEVLEPLAEKSDIILYDLKHLDSPEHERMTGVPNELIIANLHKLSAKGCSIWLRIVVVPGYTDSVEYHRRVVGFLASLPKPVERIDLLPFHNWCEDKYGWLGRQWPLSDIEALDPAEVDHLLDIYKTEGLNATIGGSGFENSESVVA
ncbi:MAG: glycyl-radical enzyme activating protein [Geobacteraceae bacterium]